MALSPEQRAEIGSRLAELRQFDLRLNQAEMASKLGISRSYYSQIERGTAPFTITKIEELCQHAKLDPEPLLGFLRRELEIAEEPAAYSVTPGPRIPPERIVAATIAFLQDHERMSRITLAAKDLGLSVETLVTQAILKQLDDD